MKITRKPITKEEEEFLKNNFWELGCTECGKILNRSVATISSKAKRMGLKIRPDILFDRYDISGFTEFKDPFIVYFLGFFWADGSITPAPKHRVKFKINSIDFLDLKHNMYRLGNFWNCREYPPPKNKPHWKNSTVFEVTNLYLWQFFKDCGYLSKTGGSAYKILSKIPDNLKHYWWRGYFDGDGCISNSKVSLNACMDQDWSFVAELENKLNINFIIERKDRGSRSGSKINISNYPYILRFSNYIYNGEQFGLKRKKDRFDTYLLKSRKKLKTASSKYFGVSKAKNRNKWTMQITHNGKLIRGQYKNEIDAAKEYNKLAIEVFGNKAFLNSINE